MRLHIVDAFADGPFSGNPAAVCLLERPAPESWMQSVACEMNLSETAFVVPDGDGLFGLRWFTPRMEVDLCGHATLASAHALFETGTLEPAATAHFETRSGRLGVSRDDDGRLAMDFPSTPPEPADAPVGFAELFGAVPVWTGRTAYDLFAVLPDEAAVRSLAPDPRAVAMLDARGVVLTARADEGRPYDVVSRFFAPQVGIDEDAVTGSAHCGLGPYWAEQLGTDTLRCYQASARGGFVGVRVLGERVELTGRAVTVLRGDLLPDPDGPSGPEC